MAELCIEESDEFVRFGDGTESDTNIEINTTPKRAEQSGLETHNFKIDFRHVTVGNNSDWIHSLFPHFLDIPKPMKARAKAMSEPITPQKRQKSEEFYKQSQTNNRKRRNSVLENETGAPSHKRHRASVSNEGNRSIEAVTDISILAMENKLILNTDLYDCNESSANAFEESED